MTPGGTDGFRAALLDPRAAVPEGLTDGAGRPAGRRFAVYRNNVAVSLTEALETGFPAVRALLGEANFRGFAGLYLRRYPPVSPLMMEYGEAFAAFLAGLDALKEMPWLPDVARLEHALRLSYHAADATPVPQAALAAIPPETLGDVRLRLVPAALVIRSQWPVVDIRRHALRPDTPKPGGGAQDVLIARRGFDPCPHVLPAGGGAFLTALAEGRTLGEAHGAALEAGGCDLPAILTLLMAEGAIAAAEVQR